MQGGSSFFRFILILGAVFLAFQYFGQSDKAAMLGQPVAAEPSVTPPQRAPYRYCELWTNEFHATLTSRGATLKHFKLTTAKYSHQGTPIDLSTTPAPGVAANDPDAENPSKPGLHEFRQQLFVHWRNPTVPKTSDAPLNVAFDSVDYDIVTADGKSCEFVYRDDAVELRKTVRTTERPYELEITAKITNLAAEPRRHAAAIDTVAWRLNSEVAGSLFSVSPFISHVECKPAHGDTVRLLPDSFDPDDFEDPAFAATKPWGWYAVPGTPSFTSVSNAYFSQALAPTGGPAEPSCQLLIENRFENNVADAPGSGRFYRARLAYPEKILVSGQSEAYSALSYVGPKERKILDQAGGGNRELSDLIDLGFFSAIAKVLVGFLLAVHSVIPTWGVAIIILTITARLLLFPLMWPGIKNMVRMRELKPEMDAMNEKFKDDPRAKGLAQMELYRKHNVNLFLGCIPTFATMPVWFALYTTLQTAVELYNIPFLWFPDLSQPDPYFILPFIIGATFFVQQKMTPMQGDPMQQKMMMYFMPGMFTVFMLFLPAGLGVYMFTNSVLGILQQQTVEWHAKRVTGLDHHGKQPSVKTGSLAPSKKQQKKSKGDSDTRNDEGDKADISKRQALLDKGKA